MSDGEELVYHEVINPVYRALLEHVKVETLQARHADDIFGYSIGCIALKQAGVEFEFEADYLRSKFEEAKTILDKGDLRPILNTELLQGLFLAYKALILHNKLTKNCGLIIKEILQLLPSRRWLDSTDLASYTCFSFEKDKAFKEQVDKAAIWLGEQLQRQYERKAYVNYVSALLGAAYSEAPLNWLSLFESEKVEALLRKNLLTPRDTARLGLALMQLSRKINIEEKLVGEVVLKAEREVETEFQQAPVILLDQSIREALGLVESGISVAEANEIIRRVGGELSESIQLTEEGKVVLQKFPPSISLPILDPERHSFILMLLSQAGRDKEFLIDRHNLEKARDGVNLLRKGHTTVSKRTLSVIKGLSTIIVFLFTFSLSTILSGITWADIFALSEFLRRGEIAIASLPISLMIGFYLTVVWFRLLDTAFTYGNIPKSRWMHIFPFINRAYRAIKGGPHERTNP